MKKLLTHSLVTCGILLFAACSDNSSSAEGGCPLASQLPPSKIKWEEMTEYDTGTQFCTADIWGEMSMNAEELNNYNAQVIANGFDMSQMDWGDGYKYEFTKREGDATTTFTFAYSTNTGVMSEISITKSVKQYVNGGMDRIIEGLTPLLPTIASTPTIITWQTTSETATASGSTYKGKTSAELDAFVSQLAAAGWQNMMIEFVVNTWMITATNSIDGANYMLSVNVTIVSNYSGSTWETAESSYSDSQLSLIITKI